MKKGKKEFRKGKLTRDQKREIHDALLDLEETDFSRVDKGGAEEHFERVSDMLRSNAVVPSSAYYERLSEVRKTVDNYHKKEEKPVEKTKVVQREVVQRKVPQRKDLEKRVIQGKEVMRKSSSQNRLGHYGGPIRKCFAIVKADSNNLFLSEYYHGRKKPQKTLLNWKFNSAGRLECISAFFIPEKEIHYICWIKKEQSLESSEWNKALFEYNPSDSRVDRVSGEYRDMDIIEKNLLLATFGHSLARKIVSYLEEGDFLDPLQLHSDRKPLRLALDNPYVMQLLTSASDLFPKVSTHGSENFQIKYLTKR